MMAKKALNGKKMHNESTSPFKLGVIIKGKIWLSENHFRNTKTRSGVNY